MNALQQAQGLIQSYQHQMNQLQEFINGAGKALVPAQAETVSAPQAPAVIPSDAPDKLTQEQSAMLMGLFKAFVADDSKDGARELTNGLMKFGRFAQSEFDKLKPKT